MEQIPQSPAPTNPSPAFQEPPPSSTRSKNLLLPIALIVLGVGLVGVGGYITYQNLPEVKMARMIKECLANGGSLGESYPPQCIFPSPQPSPTSSEPASSPSATPKPTSSVKTLTYSLPQGWQTVQDATGQFEVGFDPATMKTRVDGATVSIDKPKTTPGTWQYMMIKLLPYSGGSRHQFIYDAIGEQPQAQDHLPTYHEVEYRFNNRSCLFLIGIIISQSPDTWGMCDAGGGQAFYIWSYGEYETVLRTLRKL